MLLSEMYPGMIGMYRGAPVKVEKLGRKYAVILTESGDRYRVYPAGVSSHVPAGTAFDLKVSTAEALFKGSVVRRKGDEKLYVVLGKRDGTYSIAILGGAGGRYTTGVSATQLENVNLNINVEEAED